MSGRERILLIIVVASLVTWIVVANLENLSLPGAISGGPLDAERATFDRFQDLLRDRAPGIAERLNEVAPLLPEVRINQTPEATFVGELDRLLHEQGWPAPILKRPEREFFENDSIDYYYIDIPIETVGKLQQNLDTLVELERQGLLIKSFSLTKGSNADVDVSSLRAVVSRLARMNDRARDDRTMVLRRGR